MLRVFTALTALLLAVVLTGCGGQGEKGVNKDKDRPKVEETKQD